MATLPMKFSATALSLLALMSSGCGDGRPTRVPISGKVLIDGRPLEYGFIQFVSPDSRPSSAKIDEQGHFVLKCFEAGDGAVPGQHSVIVMANEAIGASKTLWHAPKKYASSQTSELQQEVVGPANDVVINLSWAGGQPFVEDDNTGAIERYNPQAHKRTN